MARGSFSVLSLSLALAASACIDPAPVPDGLTGSDAGATPATDAGGAADSGTPAQAAFPILFEDNFTAGLSIAYFSSANDIRVDTAEAHSGSASLRVGVPSTGYIGGALKADAPRSLAAYNAVTFWAKASVAGKLLNVVGLGNNAGSTTYFAERNALPLTTEWTRFVIPLPLPGKLTAEDGLFHFAEGSDEGSYTFWLDDIRYEALPASELGTPQPAFAGGTFDKLVGDSFTLVGTSVAYMLGGNPVVIATAPSYFTFTSSAPTVLSVDSAGLATALTPGSATVTGTLGDLAAPSSLAITVSAVTAPATAAPAPTVTPGSVISLLSGAFSNRAVDTWSASWDMADVADATIGGVPTKKYTSLSYAGIEFYSAAGALDATEMTVFHLDLWTPDASRFGVKLVDFGPNGVYGADDTDHELIFEPTTTPALTKGSWVSLELPLSSFTKLTSRAHLAQLILSSNGNTVYVQNAYFHK